MDSEQNNSNNSKNSLFSHQNSDIREINIIEEMRALNQKMQEPDNGIFKVSSSWDKHSNVTNNKNIEIMMKEIMNYMIKIDTTLTKIEAILSK